MKRKSLSVLIGSACLALVLVALLFVGACAKSERTTSPTVTTSPTGTTEPQEPQGTPEPTTPSPTEPQEPQGTPEPTTPSPEAKTSPCDELMSLFQEQDATITSATIVAATATVPEHCDVRGKISPDIGFAVELPTDWNGKFYMVGNGVFAGNKYTAMQKGLSMGYATASTDSTMIVIKCYTREKNLKCRRLKQFVIAIYSRLKFNYFWVMVKRRNCGNGIL
jgi:hypothetical protein